MTMLSQEGSIGKSRKPDARHLCPAPEVERIVVSTRLELYNLGLPSGPRAIRKYPGLSQAIGPLPSERTIARWLSKHGLTHARTGWYPGEEDIHGIAK